MYTGCDHYEDTMMSSANPYEAPQASLQNPKLNDVYDQTSPFSASGRFGRANYVVYAFGAYLVFTFIMWVVTVTGYFLKNTAAMVLVGVEFVIFLVGLVFAIIFLIRRLHDLNWSGWLSVLTVVPLANLVIAIPCLFFRGTDGVNNYGPPPKPNKVHNVLAGIMAVMMIVGLIGIVAAISIPAYQKYAQQAQEISQQMPQ